MNVSLKVGPVDKTVRIRGFSVFQRGSFGGVVPGPARPLKEPVPLIYELAYGGCDVTNPERPVAEPRNPVGRGVAREINDVVGHPANQLEHPSDPRAPACFGAIHRHWQPRASFAGTYDAAWMETRMPLLPTDFDPRFHVSVPPDQWSESPLRGDEPIEVLGVTPEGSWRFQLPRLAIGFSSVVRGRRSEHRTYLDTVLVDADARRIELTWRASVPLPPKWEDVEKILVFEKSVL